MRYLMNAVSALNDYEKPHLPIPKLAAHNLENKIKDTDIEILLKENNLI